MKRLTSMVLLTAVFVNCMDVAIPKVKQKDMSWNQYETPNVNPTSSSRHPVKLFGVDLAAPHPARVPSLIQPKEEKPLHIGQGSTAIRDNMHVKIEPSHLPLKKTLKQEEGVKQEPISGVEFSSVAYGKVKQENMPDIPSRDMYSILNVATGEEEPYQPWRHPIHPIDHKKQNLDRTIDKHLAAFQANQISAKQHDELAHNDEVLHKALKNVRYGLLDQDRNFIYHKNEMQPSYYHKNQRRLNRLRTGSDGRLHFRKSLEDRNEYRIVPDESLMGMESDPAYNRIIERNNLLREQNFRLTTQDSSSNMDKLDRPTRADQEYKAMRAEHERKYGPVPVPPVYDSDSMNSQDEFDKMMGLQTRVRVDPRMTFGPEATNNFYTAGTSASKKSKS